MEPAEIDPGSLDRLRDIAMPPEPTWWPPAPGWVVLGLLALAAASVLLFLLVRRHLRQRYRRTALAELAELASRDAPVEVPALIRRTALAAFDRERVVGLTGEAWLEFLDRTGSTREFTQGSGRLLPGLAYDATLQLSQNDRDGLFASARNWILRHDPSTPPGEETGS